MVYINVSAIRQAGGSVSTTGGVTTITTSSGEKYTAPSGSSKITAVDGEIVVESKPTYNKETGKFEVTKTTIEEAKTQTPTQEQPTQSKEEIIKQNRERLQKEYIEKYIQPKQTETKTMISEREISQSLNQTQFKAPTREVSREETQPVETPVLNIKSQEKGTYTLREEAKTPSEKLRRIITEKEQARELRGQNDLTTNPVVLIGATSVAVVAGFVEKPSTLITAPVQFGTSLITKPKETVSGIVTQATTQPSIFIGEQLGTYFTYKGISKLGDVRIIKGKGDENIIGISKNTEIILNKDVPKEILKTINEPEKIYDYNVGTSFELSKTTKPREVIIKTENIEYVQKTKAVEPAKVGFEAKPKEVTLVELSRVGEGFKENIVVVGDTTYGTITQNVKGQEYIVKYTTQGDKIKFDVFKVEQTGGLKRVSREFVKNPEYQVKSEVPEKFKPTSNELSTQYEINRVQKQVSESRSQILKDDKFVGKIFITGETVSKFKGEILPIEKPFVSTGEIPTAQIGKGKLDIELLTPDEQLTQLQEKGLEVVESNYLSKNYDGATGITFGISNKKILSPTDMRVAIQKGLSEKEAITTRAHELVHVEQGIKGTLNNPLNNLGEYSDRLVEKQAFSLQEASLIEKTKGTIESVNLKEVQLKVGKKERIPKNVLDVRESYSEVINPSVYTTKSSSFGGGTVVVSTKPLEVNIPKKMSIPEKVERAVKTEVIKQEIINIIRQDKPLYVVQKNIQDFEITVPKLFDKEVSKSVSEKIQIVSLDKQKVPVSSVPKVSTIQSDKVDVKSETSFETTPISKIDIKTDIKPVTEIKTESKVSSKIVQEIKQLPKIDTKIRSEVKQNLIQEVRQEQVQEQRQELKQEVITQKVSKTSLFTLPKPKEVLFPPPLKTFVKPEKEGKGLFQTLVRRKGKFETRGSFKTQEEAVRRGVFITGQTSTASFKVLKKGQPIDLGRVSERYQASKKEKGVQIQKSKFRISSAGEKAEITYSPKKKGKKLFGGM